MHARRNAMAQVLEALMLISFGLRNVRLDARAEA